MFKPNEWLHQEILSPHHCSHVVSWHKEGQSLGFLHCAVSLAFIHVMYWPFDIHWLGGNGRSFNFELSSSNHVCFLLLGGLVSDQISLEFSSPVEISFLFSLSVCTRDADLQWRMPWRAEHRKGVSYWSAGCQFRQASGSYCSNDWQPKPKNWTSASTKDFLKRVMLIPTETKEFCQIQIMPEEREHNYFKYSKLFRGTGHF